MKQQNIVKGIVKIWKIEKMQYINAINTCTHEFWYKIMKIFFYYLYATLFYQTLKSFLIYNRNSTTNADVLYHIFCIKI